MLRKPENVLKVSIISNITRTFSGLKNEKLEALDCGDDAAEWLSRFLLQKDNGLRLGYHGGFFKRDIEKVHSKTLKFYKNFKNDAAVTTNTTTI